MISRFIILFSFVLFVHFSFGQKINWTQYDCVPFKENSTLNFATSNYYKAQYHFPPNDLTESNAVLEIRVFPMMHHREDRDDLPMKIFQFYEDSTVLTEYYLETDPEVVKFIKKYKDSSSETYSKGITPLLEKAGGRLWRIVRKSIQVNEAKNMIAELTKMNLFTIDRNEEITNAENKINTNPIYSKFIQNYKIQKGPITGHGASFEIKYKNKYRVFGTCSLLFYYYTAHTMETIQRLNIGYELVKYLMPEMRMPI